MITIPGLIVHSLVMILLVENFIQIYLESQCEEGVFYVFFLRELLNNQWGELRGLEILKQK